MQRKIFATFSIGVGLVLAALLSGCASSGARTPGLNVDPTLTITITVDSSYNISVSPEKGEICWDKAKKDDPNNGGKCNTQFAWKLNWLLKADSLADGQFVRISRKKPNKKNGKMFGHVPVLAVGNNPRGKPHKNKDGDVYLGWKSKKFDYGVEVCMGTVAQNRCDKLLGSYDPEIMPHSP